MTSETLNQRFLEAWALILDGATNRRNPCHTPVVATIGEAGLPQQRVMVLRAANQDTRLLRFHTDARAHKVNELTALNAVSILLYNAQAKVQLRLSGTGHTRTNGEDIDAIWQDADRFARRCYMTGPVPGSVASEPTSGLPAWVQGIKPEEADLVPARANFAILLAEIKRVEWLYLATTGHRRARWDWDDEAQAWNGCWLVP
jgi:pyridoxamine 5'-phosphate oxidase